MLSLDLDPTEEEPNALLPEEVAPFMSRFKAEHPEHFAMVYLGLITGLRPSSLRPLRRRGEEADVLWEKHRIWFGGPIASATT